MIGELCQFNSFKAAQWHEHKTFKWHSVESYVYSAIRKTVLSALQHMTLITGYELMLSSFQSYFGIGKVFSG